MTKESAYQIAEAYQMEGVSDAVRGMVVDEVGRELAGKVKEWTVEAFDEGRRTRDERQRTLMNL